MLAAPLGLDQYMFEAKAARFGGVLKRARIGQGDGFDHAAALRADQESGQVILAGTGAGDEGIEPLDPVHEPVHDEEIERPVGSGRLCAESFGLEPFQYVIGAHGPVFLKQYLQRPAAHRGKTQALLRAPRLRGLKGGGNAMGVVMAGKAGWRGRGGHGINGGLEVLYYNT